MDELEKIDNSIKNTLISLLFKKIPEYEEYIRQIYPDFHMEEESVYLFMNEFATYLSERIIENDSSELVVNSFLYINSLGESNNLEILNIVKVGILEILYTSGLNRDKVYDMLIPRLRIIFNECSKYYR